MSVTDGEFREGLVRAISSIAHGDVHAPGGIEGLTMSLVRGAGPTRAENVADGLFAIASALSDVAEAIREHGGAEEADLL